MTKYRNPFFDELNDDAAAPDAAASGEPEEATPSASNADTWESRYRELRRHEGRVSSALQEAQKENERLRAELESAAKEQFTLPKSEEEIEEFARKFPEVFDVMQTVALKVTKESVEEASKPVTERLAALDKREKEAKKQAAMAELKALHPDCIELFNDNAFKDWLAEQPTHIQDSLLRNDTDARAAARSIDLYKMDMAANEKAPASDASRDAARSVGNTRSATPAAKPGVEYRESEVEKMSAAEYERHEEAIREAIRAGRFVYDLSGAK